MAASSKAETLGSASLKYVGRIECAPGKTTDRLYVTICDDTSSTGGDGKKVLHVMKEISDTTAASLQQQWCFVSGSETGSSFYICNASLDSVMMADSRENPTYSGSRARCLQIVKISDLFTDTPLDSKTRWVEEGKPLPNLGIKRAGDSLDCFQFYLKTIDGSSSGEGSPRADLISYNIHSNSGFFGPKCTIIQAGSGYDPPQEMNEMVVHSINGVCREEFQLKYDAPNSPSLQESKAAAGKAKSK